MTARTPVRPGLVVQQRSFLIRPALWFPFATQLLIGVRWLLWAWAGWWFTFLPVFAWMSIQFGHPILLVALWVDWPMVIVGLWQYFEFVFAQSTDKDTRLEGLVAAGTPVFAVLWFSWLFNKHTDPQIVGLVRRGVYAIGFVTSFVWAVQLTGPLVLWMLLAFIACFGVDVGLASRSRKYDMIRMYCQWQRERPTMWALVASVTKRVQSRDDAGIERQLTLAAQLRPLLESPACWVFPIDMDWELGESTIRMFAPPARNLVAVNEVLPQWSAQMHTVRNENDAMQFTVPSGDDLGFATFGVLRIKWGVAESFPVPLNVANLGVRGWLRRLW